MMPDDSDCVKLCVHIEHVHLHLVIYVELIAIRGWLTQIWTGNSHFSLLVWLSLRFGPSRHCEMLRMGPD